MKEVRRTRRITALLIVVVTLCVLLVLFLIHYSSRRSKTERYLKEKYGEEFVIADDWTTLAGDHVGKHGVPFVPTYWAVCTPESGSDIYFSFHTDFGFDEIYDTYYSSLLNYQLSQMLQIRLKEYFGQCLAVGEFTMINDFDFKNSADAAVENVLAGDYDKSVSYKLAINTDVYKSSNYEEEYEVIINALEELNQIGLQGTLIIYFLPEEGYEEFAQIFKYKHETGAGTEREELNDKYEQIFILNDENGLTSQENYIKQREAMQ